MLLFTLLRAELGVTGRPLMFKPPNPPLSSFTLPTDRRGGDCCCPLELDAFPVITVNAGGAALLPPPTPPPLPPS